MEDTFEQDLVPGTRIVVQSLPAPLNGRCGKVVDYDRVSKAYIVHVDGGNPRTIYRENLRIMADQSTPVLPPKRQPGRPQTRLIRDHHPNPSSYASPSVRPGDQVLLCLEQFQFTLMEVTGIRRVCKSEPCSYAIAAVLDDSDIPGWMRKPPPVAGKNATRVPGFRVGDPVYAVWDQDARWYPGRVKEDYVEKFEIEWVDPSAAPSLVKKSLVCKRTTFDDLRNRPSYLAALNVASRTGGMRGLKASVVEEEKEKEEETVRKAELAAMELFPNDTSSKISLGQEEWNIISKGMQIMERFGIDGLVNSDKNQVFKKHIWNSDVASRLQLWLTEGSGLTTQSVADKLKAPARSTLEASLSKTWNRPMTLPRGPLDIFR